MTRRYFRRLLVAYWSIVVLVTVLVTSAFYLVNRAQTLRDIDFINHELLDKSAGIMDGAIRQAFAIVDRILIDADFRDLVRAETLDFYGVTQTVERLRLDSGVFGDGEFLLGILIPGTELVVTTDFTVDLGSYLDFVGYEGSPDRFFKGPGEESGFGSDLLVVRESVYRDSDTPATPVVSFISSDRIYRLGTVHVFIHFAKASLFPVVEADVSGEFQIRYEDTVVSAGQSSARTDTQTGADWKVYERDSSYVPGLEYLYVADPAITMGRLSTARLVSGLVAVLALLLGSVVAYVWVGRLYRPIKHLVGTLSSTPDPGSDELSFIRSEALRLQIRNEHLRHQVEEYRIPIRAKVYRDVFLGVVNAPGGGDVRHTGVYGAVQEELQSGLHVALVALLPQHQAHDSLNMRGAQNVRFVVSALIHEEIPKRLDADVVDVDETTLAAVIREPYSDEVRRALHDACAAVEQSQHVRVVVAVGSVARCWDELRVSFVVAMSLIRGLPIDETRVVVDQRSISTDRTDRVWYPQETERALIYAVESNDPARVYTVVERLVSVNVTERKLSHRSLELLANMLTGTAQRLLERGGIAGEADRLAETPALRSWAGADISIALRDEVHGFFCEIASQLTEQRDKREQETGRLMAAYVAENSTRDLSLLDLAEHFNLSPSYAGKAFKRCTGESFKDFLNLCRVRTAKQALELNPNAKTKDLAQDSGFNNANSFIRMFKRYEGVTPREYVTLRESRREARKGQEPSGREIERIGGKESEGGQEM